MRQSTIALTLDSGSKYKIVDGKIWRFHHEFTSGTLAYIYTKTAELARYFHVFSFKTSSIKLKHKKQE